MTYEICPKCNTELVNCPGIGPYCPNSNCDIIDNILESNFNFTISKSDDIIESILCDVQMLIENKDPITYEKLHNKDIIQVLNSIEIRLKELRTML